MPDTTGGHSLTGRRGEDHRLGLCYAMILGGLQSTLFYMLQDGGCQKRSLRKDSLSPLFRLSAVQSTYNSLIPVDSNAYICSVAPCLRVLWMSTHSCFSPPFPLSYIRLLQLDVGVQEPDASVDDYYYYSGGAYYYVQPADGDQE